MGWRRWTRATVVAGIAGAAAMVADRSWVANVDAEVGATRRRSDAGRGPAGGLSLRLGKVKRKQEEGGAAGAVLAPADCWCQGGVDQALFATLG